MTANELQIVVLVKQVTDTQAPARLLADGSVDRAALPAMLNPDDREALEAALQLRDRIGGCVTAVSMGPDRAEEVLREVVARGADRAILLSDRRYAGADTLATAYALATAARRLDAEVVFAGRQSIDGDTAHVGPQVAEELQAQQITGVEAIVDATRERITVRRRIDGVTEELSSPLPVVLTVGGGALKCRPEQIKRLLTDRKRPITKWDAATLEADPARLGTTGSATRVIRSTTIEHPERDTRRVGADEASLRTLIAELADKHLIY